MTAPRLGLKVDAETAAADAKLQATQVKAEAVAHTRQLKVDADTAAAAAKLEATQLKADELDRKRVQVKADADTAAAQAQLAALGSAVSGAAGSFPLLVAAGLSIGPAIIPVAAAAVAAIAAIGTAAADYLTSRLAEKQALHLLAANAQRRSVPSGDATTRTAPAGRTRSSRSRQVRA